MLIFKQPLGKKLQISTLEFSLLVFAEMFSGYDESLDLSSAFINLRKETQRISSLKNDNNVST